MQRQSIFIQQNRQKNAVDKLQEEISCIQQQCNHNFKKVLGEEFPELLEESLIKDVCLGEDKYHLLIAMKLQCTKCNLHKISTVKETCLRCLGKMEKQNLEHRKKYWGKVRPHYDSRLYLCRGCNLTVIVDEWCV